MRISGRRLVTYSKDAPLVPTFLDAYLQYAEARTAAPSTYHYYSAVSVCAAALGNRAFIDSDWARIYPAMWIALVGPSNTYKTTALSMASGILSRAEPEMELPQTFSAEAIIEHLAHRPYGLLRWGELGVGMEFMAKDYSSGIISSLCDLWDARPVTRLTKTGGNIRVERAALSILAGGKPQWFMEYAKTRRNVGMSVGTGFFGRWMFVFPGKRRAWHGMFERNGTGAADQIVMESLVDHVKALLAHEGEVAPGPGSLVIDAWLKEMDAQWDDDSDPAEFSKRAGANVAKLAMGIQATRGTGALLELEEKAVEQAIAMWEHSFHSGRELVNRIMGQSEDAEELDRYDKALGTLGGHARQRDLLRKLKVTSAKFAVFASTLEEQGQWEKELVANPGNKASVFWRRK